VVGLLAAVVEKTGGRAMTTIEKMSNRIIQERQRDIDPKVRDKDLLLHQMVAGLAEESGEIAGLLKRVLRDGSVPQERWLDELGDLFWYLVNVADMVGLSIQDCYKYNETKLRGRYS